jgi:phage gp37-like protein
MPLGFQVQLNDETPIRAGDDGISVLTAMVTYVASRQEIELRIGGLFARQSSGQEHVEWLQRELRVGDRIVLTVTDSRDVDPPAHRTQQDLDLAEQMERK